MIIRGVEIVGEDGGPRDIAIAGDTIVRVDPAAHPTSAASNGQAPVFRDAIAFPGLINSHDHLEFNLYPRLGHGPYADYVAWGRDIHRRDKKLIASVEDVPRAYRTRWGAVKNLLAGVTSVGHHGEPAGDLPIQLLGGTAIHSTRLDSKWRWRLNAPVSRAPYVLHIGEGTSRACHREIDRVIRWNLFRRDLIGVHAIAMGAEQATRFRAVVWCPVSNEFLYGQTADIRSLKRSTTVVFGTDSTLTGDWNIWNHLRHARTLGALTNRELFDAVTRSAAAVWNRPRIGQIAAGALADVAVARKKSSDPWEAFFALNPEDILLVVRKGVPLLIDRSLDWAPPSWTGHGVAVGKSEKIIVEDLPALLKEIRARGLESNLDLGAA